MKPHSIQTPKRLDRADQHRASRRLPLRDNVGTLLGVDRIDVQRTRILKHRLALGSDARMRMAGRITRGQIRFGLDDSSTHPLIPDSSGKTVTDQRRPHDTRMPSEESSAQSPSQWCLGIHHRFAAQVPT